MTHLVIKIEKYLLVVDDSEIKDDVWHLDNGVIKKWKGNLHSNRLTSKKIIYHLPLNNAPILEGVPLLPPLEDEDISNLTFQAYKEQEKWTWSEFKDIFPAGYNKAKEKHKYTEEDLKKAIDMAWILAQEEESIFSAKEKIIQSLQQPKYPVAFECEMVLHLNETWSTELGGGILSKPKTITNPQGLTQLVGKYIY